MAEKALENGIKWPEKPEKNWQEKYFKYV